MSQANRINTTTGASALQNAWAAYAQNRPAFEAGYKRYQDALLSEITAGRLSAQVWASDTYGPKDKMVKRQAKFAQAEAIDERTHKTLSAAMMCILHRSPTDFSDLALAANACAAANCDLWRVPKEDLDWNGMFVRNLVEGVLDVLGAQLIFDGLPLPQELGTNAFEAAAQMANRQAA